MYAVYEEGRTGDREFDNVVAVIDTDDFLEAKKIASQKTGLQFIEPFDSEAPYVFEGSVAATRNVKIKRVNVWRSRAGDSHER